MDQSNQKEHKRERMADEIRRYASDFIQRESNYTSMITITNVVFSKDFKKVTFFVTVFPENQEKAAIDFLKRNRGSVKAHIKKHSRLSRLPHVEFEIDSGEKSRQNIDKISQDIDLG